MSGTQPVGLYALKIPAGDIMVPGCPEFAAMFRVSMAAIDPSEEPEVGVDAEHKPARATLKIVRVPSDMFADDSEEDDEDYDDELVNGVSDEDNSEDEEVSGGSSSMDSKKAKLAKLLQVAMDEDEDMDDDDEGGDDEEDEEEAKAVLKKLMKGKDKAADGEDADSDIDDDEESLEMDETVICTLDPAKNYQQPIDIVVGEDERVFFKVSGTHTVHLTGNYVIPLDDGRASLYDEDEEGDEYDLSPDEDELDALEDEDEESDELDDLEDPRVHEVDTDEEPPKLIEPAASAKPIKGKNKRPAEDSADEDNATGGLDDLMAKDIKNDAATPAINGGEQKLTKAEKKKLKKQKKNDGEAAAVDNNGIGATAATSDSKQESKTPKTTKEPTTNGTSSEKKVQFAKNLEQGPTPSATPPAAKAAEQPKKTATTSNVRDVQGVTVDDRKTGSGAQAKKGSKIEMRYIGKLENGKVFDSNKSGKPFGFKLGMGEVIKGWDVGIAGMAAGGERRLTIPSQLAYGKKGAPPDIPPNARLTFDVKCLSVK